MIARRAMCTIGVAAVAALTACSGGGASPSAPASASSKTVATFTVHWPSSAQSAASSRRRETISVSTQSISVSVNSGVATVVNKPTIAGSPSSTSVSIPAPAGNDSFTFTAWDEVGGTGSVLDKVTTTQDIIANANNAVSVTLEGVCAALVPTLATPSVYAETTNVTTPLSSGTRTVLTSARLVGNFAQTFAFTPVDADGNTILTGAGTVPISVVESGPTHHVTITPSTTGAGNTTFTVTPLVAEPDGFATQLTASSPNCGSGTTKLPNGFALSTSADVLVADFNSGVLAFDQDGTPLATIVSECCIKAIAYNAKSNYLVAISEADEPSGPAPITFQTLTPAGTLIGSGSFKPTVPSNVDNYDASSLAYNPTSGEFVVGIFTTSNAGTSSVTYGGAIQLAAISGSTATLAASNFKVTNDPVSVVVLPNGNVVVADFQADITQFDASGNRIASVDEPGVALTVDTSRGNIIAEDSDPSVASNGIGAIVTTAGTDIAYANAFTLPRGTLQNGGTGNVIAYNQGNDEVYVMGPSVAGLSASSIYEGGSAQSNLPIGAFASVHDPTGIVVIP